ncbi:MAG: nitrate ABC transporter, permease protein [Nitrospina sp.]|nr:nitrate ABC transporter, permease protein [Nitrospina sp.]|tara:strand:- start:2686 stop:3591 length:906 start_codon:yes stop_codon:yes gene_type:complete
MKEQEKRTRQKKSGFASAMLSLMVLGFLILVWHLATVKPKFEATGLTEDELMLLEFNGDIIRTQEEGYKYNPKKNQGIPGPLTVFKYSIAQFSEPFHKNGTNDHGIGHLVVYTIERFFTGFILASVIAICLGVVIGLNPFFYEALNPFFQVLKPVSPLAWMPLLLYTVKDPKTTAILVVFMAALWPTMANTAFGVKSLRKEFLHVASILQLTWFSRLFRIVLPGAAPAIVAGLRISFGAALVAVVPAEMLLGELGVGYLTWIEWNNLDISGVLFAIGVIGIVGWSLDLFFNRVANSLTYSE